MILQLFVMAVGVVRNNESEREKRHNLFLMRAVHRDNYQRLQNEEREKWSMIIFR